MTLARHRQRIVNVGDVERALSLAAGGALLYLGITRGGRKGALMAVAGGLAAFRGASGYSFLYHALGIHRTERTKSPNTSVPYELGVRFDHTFVVKKPASDLYLFWRNLANLPRFMEGIENVYVIDYLRSRWIARGPGGRRFEWDAEVVNDVPGNLIGWRSLEGSDVDHAGSVRFTPLPGGETEVKVELQYNPPGGFLGAGIAKLLFQNPERQIRRDLERFKQLMETGSLEPTGGQRERKTWREKDRVQEASEESFPASDSPSWTSSKL